MDAGAVAPPSLYVLMKVTLTLTLVTLTLVTLT